MNGPTMDVVLRLAAGLALGAGAGAVFFGGLAWTVRRLPTSRVPARLVMAGLLLRLAMVGAAAVAAGVLGLAALTGLLVALLAVRTLWLRRFGSGGPKAVTW